MLHAQHDAENVGVEYRGIGFCALSSDLAALTFGACIVYRDIEAAKPCDSLIDQRADLILLADIGVDEFGLRP